MTVVLAEVEATALTTDALPEVDGTVAVLDPSGFVADGFVAPGFVGEVAFRSDLLATVDLDRSVVDVMRPGISGAKQVAGALVRIDGNWLSPADLVSVRAGRSLDAGSTWTVGVVPGAVAEPLRIAGPPPGQGEVEVWGFYVTASGHRFFPVVTGGVALSWSETDDNRTGRTWVISGAGPEGRWVCADAELVLPPGHGLARGEVVRRLAAAAGVSSAMALDDGGRMYRGLQHDSGEWMPVARSVLEPDGRVLLWDAAATLRNPVRGAGRGDVAAMEVIGEQDVLVTGWSRSITSDGPACITLFGTRQLTREECGRETRETVRESSRVYTVRRAAWNQTQSVLLAAGGPASPTELQLTQRVIDREEVDCGTVISETSETWGWLWRERARYELQTDGSRDPLGGTAGGFVWVEAADAVLDDSNPAYDRAYEKFEVITRSIRSKTFGAAGYLEREQRSTYEWRHLPEAIKSRSNTTNSWESRDYNVIPILASGDGVSEETQRFREVETRVTEHEVDAQGFVQSRTTTTSRIAHRPGERHLFQGGVEGADAVPSLRAVEMEQVFYVALADSEGRHREHRIVTDLLTGEITSEDPVERDGHLPAAERLEDLDPDPSIFDSEDQAAFARGASRRETQPIEARVCAAALQQSRSCDEQLTSDYAESTDELRAIGRARLRELSALTATLEVPVRWDLQENTWIYLHLPSLGVSAPALIRGLEHAEGNGFTTTLTVEIEVTE